MDPREEVGVSGRGLNGHTKAGEHVRLGDS
jgi:hypothetical protein